MKLWQVREGMVRVTGVATLLVALASSGSAFVLRPQALEARARTATKR